MYEPVYRCIPQSLEPTLTMGIPKRAIIHVWLMLSVHHVWAANQEDPSCCRCVEEKIGCATQTPTVSKAGPGGGAKIKSGLSCANQVHCDLFGGDACSSQGCVVNGTKIVNLVDVVEIRNSVPDCIFDEVLCCDPVDPGLLANKLSISQNLAVDNGVDFKDACNGDEISAIEDFGINRVCGKRDVRSYKHANLPEGFTNPGEWPWVALIFGKSGYLGAGTLVAKDTVITVAHKVRNIKAEELTVRLGDWNPQKNDEKEKFPAVEVKVDCVKIHPKSVAESLENNVAVLRLAITPQTPTSLMSVVTLYTNRFRKDDIDSPITPEKRKTLFTARLVEDDGNGPSYINNVCLTTDPAQFKGYKDRCWMAAWGKSLERQREVDMPLVSTAACEAKLRPIFAEKGIPDYRLRPSEICAGGEPGKDACVGEGGAPLVCLDKTKNQYFALGLVNFGFGCNSSLPGVYTNLQDPTVNDFITKAIGNPAICKSR